MKLQFQKMYGFLTQASVPSMYTNLQLKCILCVCVCVYVYIARDYCVPMTINKGLMDEPLKPFK